MVDVQLGSPGHFFSSQRGLIENNGLYIRVVTTTWATIMRLKSKSNALK